MKVTEQQATQKWCPMVRYTADGEVSNRHSNSAIGIVELPEYARCIGSRCMMWVEVGTRANPVGQCGLVRGVA